MDVWQLILYAGASLLALRSLVSLMSHHRHQYRRQLLIEYRREVEREKQPDAPAEEEASGESAAEPAETAA